MTDGNNPGGKDIKFLWGGEALDYRQDYVVERLIIGLLANGNVLIEGLPGLGKTRSIKGPSKGPGGWFIAYLN